MPASAAGQPPRETSTQASDMPLAQLPLIALLCLTLAGCVHDPVSEPGPSPDRDPLYLPPPPGVVGGELRTLLVEPLSVAAQWEVTPGQREALQRALVRALDLTVSEDTSFEVTADPDRADMRLQADLVRMGEGAVDARLTLRNARTGDVLLRALETRATGNLRALREVSDDDPALDILFRSWGESLRRGLLELQGPVQPGSGRPPARSS
jgi:hypothetical protein